MTELFALLKLVIIAFLGKDKHRVDPAKPVESDLPEDLTDPVSPIPEPEEETDEDYGPATNIIRTLKRLGHKVFEDNSKPYNLNIVGIRNTDPVFDKYNCKLALFWKDHKTGEWHYMEMPFTTYPGEYYTIQKHLNPLGVLIMAEGQHRGCYKLRKHRGLYDALCQDGGPVRVYRDKNRDKVYDMDPKKTYLGSYGANIHCAENPDDGISRRLWEWIATSSAGCQVVPDVPAYIEARKWWYEARKYWGDSFTYTLIRDTDLEEAGAVVDTVQDSDSSPINYDNLRAPVSNRGRPPVEFLSTLIDWAKSASPEIFSQFYRGKETEIYENLFKRRPELVGKDRKALMCEVLRVMAGFESSWRWNEGRDITNSTSNKPETEEAGVLQVSGNSMYFSADLVDCFMRHGGKGRNDYLTFRRLMKEKSDFAFEYTARLLRFTIRHHGPVKRGEIFPWISPDAVDEFEKALL